MNKALSHLYATHHSKGAYYNTTWREAGRVPLFSAFCKQYVPLSEYADVADFGSRDGYFLSRIIPSQCTVTCVDIDEHALAQSRHLLQGAVQECRTVHADLNERLPLEDESFDLIIASEIIEHLIDPAHFLSECFRLLKRGGVLVGSTPNAHRFDKRLYALMGVDPKAHSDPTHLQYFSLASLRERITSVSATSAVHPYRGDDVQSFLPSVLADGFIFVCKKTYS
ncbi:MAG: hypothetical protein RLZZ283_266 [Candidatus Parcubacteria bacterium]|jgi:SAM-dependent methyltransferase